MTYAEFRTRTEAAAYLRPRQAFRAAMQAACLAYTVVNSRTGNTVAAFILKGDALRYIADREEREGCNGAKYELTLAIGKIN